MLCMLRKRLFQQKDGHINNHRLLCCGILVCSFCEDKLDKEAEEKGKDWDCLVCRSHRPKTAKERIKMAITRVKEGRVWAFLQIGHMYYEGYGVSQSFAKAFEYYSLGAAHGDALCQYRIGAIYSEGEGVKQSDERAFKFYTQAAEQGFPIAQMNLAFSYSNGQGVEKSDKKTFEWYLRAAQSGGTEAQLGVAFCYHSGKGTEQGYEKAVHYFTLTAEKGDKISQSLLARCYYNGEGVKRSPVKAIYWFKQCLKNNKDESQCTKLYSLIESVLEYVKSHCSFCGNREGKLSLYCGRCLSAYYCNKTCQAKHWKAGGHKQECKEP